MALYDIRTVILPYCLKRVGEGKYIILNREYKPVGFNTKEKIEYKNYLINHDIKITKKIAEKLSWNGSDNFEEIWLYSGNNSTPSVFTCNAYSKRLSILGKLRIKQL